MADAIEYSLATLEMGRDQILQSYAPKRDAFSLNQRLETWERCLGWRQYHLEMMYRELMPDLPYKSGIYFMSGDRGEGKSLLAATWALRYWKRGYHVFSNASFLFGERLTNAEDIYALCDSIPPKSVVFLDEAHTLLQSQSDHTLRNTTFINSTAHLRKHGVVLILGSTYEDRVSKYLFGDIDYLVHPYTYEPWKNRNKRRAPNRLHWCYVGYTRIGPRPQQKARWAEREGIVARKNVARVDRFKPPIRDVIDAANLSDSWEMVDLSVAYRTNAAAMHKRYKHGRLISAGGEGLAGGDANRVQGFNVNDPLATELDDLLVKLDSNSSFDYVHNKHSSGIKQMTKEVLLSRIQNISPHIPGDMVFGYLKHFGLFTPQKRVDGKKLTEYIRDPEEFARKSAELKEPTAI